MTINRIISMFAGTVIVSSLAIAHFSSQIDLAQMSWLWLTLFVGVNLFQMAFTGFCPLATVLRAIGVKDRAGKSSCCS
jgi:hypothetical protein